MKILLIGDPNIDPARVVMEINAHKAATSMREIGTEMQKTS